VTRKIPPPALPLSPIKNTKKRAEALQSRVEAARHEPEIPADDENEPTNNVVHLAEIGIPIVCLGQ
jgi:hypothetical protein